MTQTSTGATRRGIDPSDQRPAAAPTPEQTQAAWDAIADGFDRYVTPISTPLAATALDRVTITDGARFLDVAAGTGALGISAARRGAQVTAVDISPAMVERLTARADAAGHRIDARVQNCHALDLDDDTFDLVTSLNGVTMAPIAPGLAEMVRVTRPGGTVLIAAFGALNRFEFLGFYVAAIKAAVPGFVGPPFDPPPPPFHLADPDHFRRVLTEIGLQEVQVDTVDWAAPFATGGDLWNEMYSSHPVARELVAGLSEAQCQNVRHVLDGMIAERAGGRPSATLHTEVNIGIGIKPETTTG